MLQAPGGVCASSVLLPSDCALQENERLRAQLADLRSRDSPLEAARKVRQERASDQDKFKKLIENLQVSCRP